MSDLVVSGVVCAGSSVSNSGSHFVLLFLIRALIFIDLCMAKAYITDKYSLSQYREKKIVKQK